MAYTTSDNNYGTAKLIVGTSGKANYLTIATALTAASSGDTIFILPGTYTENLTLKAGVNLTAFQCDSSLNATGVVIISGNATFTGTGSVTISGIQLQTNSAALLTVSGSNASIVNLNNCYLNCTNNTGITFSSSNASSAILLLNCNGNLGTTGIAIHTMSSIGTMEYSYCNFGNRGGSSTISNNSAGLVFYEYSNFGSPIGSTSTGGCIVLYSQINTSTQDAIAFTANGSGINLAQHSDFFGGSSAAITTTANNTSIIDCGLSSTGSAIVTGSGTLVTYQGNQCLNGGVKNTVTATAGTIFGSIVGTSGIAPTTGFLGEQVRSTATSAALTSTVAANITSISLTAGVWDVSALAQCQPSVSATAINLGISANTASFTGVVFGDSGIQSGPPASILVSVSIPSFRLTLTTTTTYFLVVAVSFSGTATATGRISATRVG